MNALYIEITTLPVMNINWFYLYLLQQLDINQADWLRNSGWDPEKENIFLVHGYAGGDDTLPISVLRDG